MYCPELRKSRSIDDMETQPMDIDANVEVPVFEIDRQPGQLYLLKPLACFLCRTFIGICCLLVFLRGYMATSKET